MVNSTGNGVSVQAKPRTRCTRDIIQVPATLQMTQEISMLTVNEYAATNQFLCNCCAPLALLYTVGVLVWRLSPFRALSHVLLCAVSSLSALSARG